MPENQGSVSRRRLLAMAGTAGVAAWTTPVIWSTPAAAQGTAVSPIACNTSIGGQTAPEGVAWDSTNGRIILANTFSLSSKVRLYSSTPLFGFLGDFGSSGTGNGQFGANAPTDVAWDPNGGRIIAADFGNDRIQIFGTSGAYLAQFGAGGTGNGQFNGPWGVAYDATNNRIIVADSFNDRIQVFDGSGAFDFAFGTTGTGNGQFDNPQYVAWDATNSRILVTDLNNDRVQVFDTNGTFDFTFGSSGAGDGQFGLPQGITWDPNNQRIIVSDLTNDRIQTFTSSGTFLETYNGAATSCALNNPRGLDYDAANNRIFVAGFGTASLIILDA